LKFPAIALQTYNRLKNNPNFLAITDFVLRTIRNEKNPIDRAQFVHQIVDDCNELVLKHPLIIEHSGCQKGCANCCHTEVSVTPDEAKLLAQRVKEGIDIDWEKLRTQKNTVEENKSFYSIPFQARACVFLDEENQCRVYEDRPSVCRTNVVIGTSEQCSTEDGTVKAMRLVNTERSDMAIMASFMLAPNENSILPKLLWDTLEIDLKKSTKEAKLKKPTIFKDREL
jgi:Fe-S-cluster containining protein